MADDLDAEIESWLNKLIATYGGVLIKAAISALMIFFSAFVFSTSVSKAALVSGICFMASLFRTWRRFLEPMSLVAFCATAVAWCHGM